ncbi:MAG: hypothetical protein ACK4TP_16190 [Hyphomicrobium sp.]|jgi:hypothetical protein
MAQRELEIGSFVQITGLEVGQMAPEASYRIEQLLTLGDGATLYKIRREDEPFDRVVGAHQLTCIATSSRF